jgi:acyl-CoA reductase-like NAD-dependent aldehyde dehydrogenase
MKNAASQHLELDTIDVREAATGASLGSVPDMSRPAVEGAMMRARTAQPGWARRSFAERAKALRRLVARMREDEALLATLARESGKPRYEAEIFELFYTLELTRFYTSNTAQEALRDELRSSRLFPNKRGRVVYHARGVVGVIGPWNWPLLNNFADCIAPLIAGNAVVLKPPEWTPLTSLRIAALWRELGLPADVFQVVTGRAEAGRAVADGCDMIFFTGSQKVGREVGIRAAERMVPAVLELGGKSAMIVLADADLQRAARAAVWSGFAHSGQVCIRTERVFVEEAVLEEFVSLCRAEMERLRHGPIDGSALFEVGAMTFPPQLAHLERQVLDARERGARVLAGGRRCERPGNWFEPTLIADADPTMLVMSEETFGPVLPIMRVKSAEEALRLTNDHPLGLSGSVWSRDLERAKAIARRVESGSVCVNDVLVNYLFVEAPLGGVKGSGLGVRHGVEGLKQFCRVETVVEDRPGLTPLSGVVGRMLGYPYEQRVLRAARALMKHWL